MKKLEYSIDINATTEKIWTTMLSPETYAVWTNISWPGSFYQGNWKQGENIRFISENGSGTLAAITQFEPYRYILANHIAVLLPGGAEDRESEMAGSWIGTTESYTFTGKDNTTHLKVEMTVNPHWEKMFNDGWPNALAKLKEICEAS